MNKGRLKFFIDVYVKLNPRHYKTCIVNTNNAWNKSRAPNTVNIYRAINGLHTMQIDVN